MRYSIICLLAASAAMAAPAVKHGHGSTRHAICDDTKKWPNSKIDLPSNKTKDQCLSGDNASLNWYEHKSGEKTVRTKKMKEAPSAEHVTCGQLVDYEMLAQAFESKNGVCDQIAKKIKKTKNKKKIDEAKKHAKHLVDIIKNDKKNYAFVEKKMQDLQFSAVDRATDRFVHTFKVDKKDPHLYSRVHALHDLMVKTKKHSLSLTHKVDHELEKHFPKAKTLTSVYLDTVKLANNSAHKLKHDEKDDKKDHKKDDKKDDKKDHKKDDKKKHDKDDDKDDNKDDD